MKHTLGNKIDSIFHSKTPFFISIFQTTTLLVFFLQNTHTQRTLEEYNYIIALIKSYRVHVEEKKPQTPREDDGSANNSRARKHRR